MRRSTYTLVVLLSLVVACGSDPLQRLGGSGGVIEEQDEGCTTLLDCPTGQICDRGVCLDDPRGPGQGDPDGEPEDLPLWVGGQWLTEYHLDWSSYLGPLAGLGAELDMLDQLLLGSSDLLELPIAGDLLRAIAEEYIPPWVSELVHLLNGVVHFFQDVRIDATMTLEHDASSPRMLRGEEVWQWGFVHVIDGCPLGEADPDYPDCALLAVPLNSATTSVGTVSARAEPFSGRIVGDQIILENREVEMEVSEFVLVVLDGLTRIATNGEHATLDDALVELVDCQAFTTEIEALMCNAFGLCSPMPSVHDGCVAAREQVVAQMTESLLAVTVDWEVMHFGQEADAFDPNRDGNADIIGRMPQAPGELVDGRFEMLISGALAGTWTAERP